MRPKLFEALGPSGLNFLADRNGDGQITADDITVNFSTTEKRADVDVHSGGHLHGRRRRSTSTSAWTAWGWTSTPT